MVEKSTQNIAIKVVTKFEKQHSDPSVGEYFFSYKITITNNSDNIVQLLRRKWFITDFAAFKKVVEGEGVIGETPILEPGESHTYTSFCDIWSGIGEMEGNYTFLNFSNSEEFKVDIPAFALIAPWILN